jgi:hypothetical protein
MNATITRYGAALLPLGVLVLGVFDAAQKSGTALIGWQTITQTIFLVVTTGAALVLPLVPGPWAGALKTGAAILGAVASALIATIPAGHITTASLILFLTAALKAVAVQIGVTIRTDSGDAAPTRGELDEASDLDLSSIATHEFAADGTPIPIVGGDEVEQSGVVDDEPGKHVAP